MLTRRLASELKYVLAVGIPALATQKAPWTSKNGPRPWRFNDFDFPIALAPQRGASFADLNFKKVVRTCQLLTILTSKLFSRHSVVQILATWTSKSAPTLPVCNDFNFQIVLAPQRGANFDGILGSRSSAPARF